MKRGWEFLTPFNLNQMDNNFLEGLKSLNVFLEEMNLSSSGNHKIDTLKKYSDNEFLIKVFQYAYNPFKNYGVTSENLKKNPDLTTGFNSFENIFDLLDELANRNITGHNAIKSLNDFINEIPSEYQDLIYYVLGGDLHMGASSTSILKVMPNIIPVFKVALANPYEPSRVNFESEEWYGSRKLDGVRCICRKEGNNVSFYSRTGKDFFTLDNLKNEILKIQGNFVLDGEVCMVDSEGNEDFQSIMKEIRKKNHTISTPKYYVFDYLTIDEFDNLEGKTKLSDRLDKIDEIIQPLSLSLVEKLPQYLIENEDIFAEKVKEADKKGYEGIMVRKNTGYQGKRTHNLLKVKKFSDAEYTVLDTINGNIRWTENGQQIEKECLSSIIVEHKGTRVGVGSGFSKEQREFYFENPSEIIGKVVTVQYFEESTNKNGEVSLRFPVVKHIHGLEREV